jgi:hypothetical protein
MVATKEITPVVAKIPLAAAPSAYPTSATGRGPGDATGRIPGEERTARHARGSGQPGSRHARNDNPASQEDRTTAVPVEEPLALLDEASAVFAEWSAPYEKQLARAAPAEEVADIVADDRGRRRDRDHKPDRELAVAREYACREDGGLAGHQEPKRLATHQRRQRGIADVRRKRQTLTPPSSARVEPRSARGEASARAERASTTSSGPRARGQRAAAGCVRRRRRGRRPTQG